MAELRAYLDHNATTPLRPAAAEAMIRALETFGNPSSVHGEGRSARAVIDHARTALARAVGADTRNIIFASGATEALNTVLRPSPAITSLSGAKRTERLLVLATEHSAALAGGGFAADAIETVPVSTDGLIDLAWLENRLAALADAAGFAPVTVAVQLANSETGVIQPVRSVSQLTDRFGALLVCDAVAAFGKIEVSLPDLNTDVIVLSAHKFGGAKGAGAIILNGETLVLNSPLLSGGGQEMRRRSGTENGPAIASMGVAAAQAAADMTVDSARITQLRDRMLECFRAARPDLVVFGEAAPRLPNTLCIAIPGQKAEIALIQFDLAGVSISSGSACSSGKVKRSHVLDAMGVNPALAETALRFSLGWNTTETDIAKAFEVFSRIAKDRPRDTSLAA
ncbi:MAG: cysteine desulfurase family protein [Beijerinckiaceae bacterium]